MSFDNIIINIVFAMVSALMILGYLKYNSIIYNKKRAILFIVLFGIINGLLSTKTASLGEVANTIKPLLLLISSVIIIKFILDLKLVLTIIVFSFLMVGTGIGNALGLLILGPFINGYVVGGIISNTTLYIMANIIVAVVTLLFLLVLKPINRLIRQILDSKELAFALIFTFVIITANLGLYYYVEIFDYSSFIAIMVMSIVYCGYLIFNSTVLYRRELEKTEKLQQEFFNKSLENALFNLRRFKHDWDNNLSVINIMLAMNKYTEAREYLQEIMAYNANSNNTSIFNIKNAGLFGIISSKQNLAKEKGIDIEIKGVGEINIIPEIKTSELCEIVGIFLDNAIEESEKVKENIELCYMETSHTIELSIKNKCINDINLSQITRGSSKGADRGNGLRIVDQIVEKYKYIQNYRSYESESKTFEQLLVIEKGH